MSENLLTNITLGENNTIKSVDLVDVVNHFRQEEFNIRKEKGIKTKKEKCVILEHKDFIKSIRTELETSKLLGLEIGENFRQSNYTDKYNRKQDCFELNEEGVLQMLNKESVFCRAKTVEYIKQLKQENKQLKEEVKELDDACKIEDKDKREYARKKSIYGWKALRNTLESCTYKNIEDTVNDIIDFHVNILKKKDRAFNYSKLDKTSYKQAVRDRIDYVLENIYNTTLDGTLRTVAKELQYINQKDKIKTINRSNSHKECASISKEPKLEDMIEIHKHPFAFNSMYVANKWGMFDRKKSDPYISWIKTFPKHEVMDMDYWTDKGVDWDLPIKLYLAFVTYEDRNFDTDGLIKSAQDMIFNRCMNIDDNIVECVEAKQIGKCSSYEDGKIYYWIENITE